MKKILFILISLFFLSQAVFPCTTFFINKNGQMVFGRNYDWVTGNGMICTNLKGLAKTSEKTSDGETISWISQHGSITFNQYGKEFPTGGMNEKGLVVELMWLDGTQYPKSDKRPAVGVLQWIQYQLDNCSSVEEVIATDAKVRISSKNVPLHYLVADAKGNAATIEFLNGKMVVHKGTDLPFPVLTNNSYEESLQQTESAIKSTGGSSLSFTNNSIDRFANACKMVSHFQQVNVDIPLIDYSFSILDKVSQGSHTKWSIVYDITNKKISFKTFAYSQIKQVYFSSFDFSCTAEAKAWDLSQSMNGNIAASFLPFSRDLNRKIVEKSFDESVSEFRVSDEDRRFTWEYALGIFCAK